MTRPPQTSHRCGFDDDVGEGLTRGVLQCQATAEWQKDRNSANKRSSLPIHLNLAGTPDADHEFLIPLLLMSANACSRFEFTPERSRKGCQHPTLHQAVDGHSPLPAV